MLQPPWSLADGEELSKPSDFVYIAHLLPSFGNKITGQGLKRASMDCLIFSMLCSSVLHENNKAVLCILKYLPAL